MFARKCSRINPEQRIKRERNLIFEFQFATALNLNLNSCSTFSNYSSTQWARGNTPYKFHSAAVNCLVTGVMSNNKQHFPSYWVPVNTVQLSLESKTHSSIQFKSVQVRSIQISLLSPSHHQDGKVHARFVTFISFMCHITFSCSVLGWSGSRLIDQGQGQGQGRINVNLLL